MPDIHYSPTFSHSDWVDEIDPIIAAGPKGFNVRLNAIQSDLRQLSTVVAQIDTSLDQLVSGTPVLPQGEQHVALPVTLVGLPGVGGGNGWFYDLFGEAHPAGGSGGGYALMGLDVPDGVQLTSFRVTGRFPAGGAVRMAVSLLRQSLVDVTRSADTLAALNESTPGMGNPFDLTIPVTTSLATVDQSTFRYVIAASAGFVSNANAVSIASLHVSYVFG